MDSSFLTGIHFCMFLLSLILFLKLLIQFGVPNHPKKFVSFALSFLMTLYLAGQISADLDLVNPWMWMKWRALPLVAGSMFLLFQSIMLLGSSSFIQQKIMSRIPVMLSVLIFGFISELADTVTLICMVITSLVVLISPQPPRHLKIIYFKFMVFISLAWAGSLVSYNLYMFGQVFGLLSLIYLYNFQHCFNIKAQLEQKMDELEEDKL